MKIFDRFPLLLVYQHTNQEQNILINLNDFKQLPVNEENLR